MSKIAFLFPGQGAQTVGMGGRLIENYPVARDLFDRASAILGYDLARLCADGPAETLDATEYAQPAIFVTSLAALEALKVDKPDVVGACAVAAGLSLGEYTALVCAGVLGFEDGVRLVQKRGKAMQAASDATPSGMVSILGLDQEKVEALCQQAKQESGTPNGVLQIANLLGPGNIVVSGNNALCERVAELAPTVGAMKAIPLAVAGAFHTPLMKPADEHLAAALKDVQLNKPRIPVISTVDAAAHDDPEAIRKILVQQILSPVLWEQTMRSLLAQGCNSFYEIGPGRVLRGLLKRIDRSAESHGIE